CCGSGWALKSGTRLLEEGDFFLGGSPSQCGIAVREATEARDDVAVADGKIEKAVECGLGRFWHARFQLLEQAHCFVLVFQRFGMLERQVKEHALYRPQRLVDPEGEPFPGPGQRAVIQG